MPAPHSVTLAGAGNIGSHAAPLLARMQRLIGHVTVVDQDRYTAANLSSQAIPPSAVGQPKAEVVAARLREISPGLSVRAIVAPLEHAPLGALRADAVLGALDSRGARVRLSDACWKLGVPLLDAGVEASGLLVRLQVHVPAPSSPCYACAIDPATDPAFQARQPCEQAAPAPEGTPATAAPASLGAVAAGLLALELEKLLAGGPGQVAAGRQVVLDAAHHQLIATRLEPARRCMLEHEVLEDVAPLDWEHGSLTLEALLDHGRRALGAGEPVTLRVHSQPFATRLVCRCGRARDLLRLAGRLAPADRTCPDCGREMLSLAFHRLERLSSSHLPAAGLRRALEDLGLLPGDIVTVAAASGRRHFEIGGSRA